MSEGKQQERCPQCFSNSRPRHHCPMRDPNGMHIDHDSDCNNCTHEWHNEVATPPEAAKPVPESITGIPLDQISGFYKCSCGLVHSCKTVCPAASPSPAPDAVKQIDTVLRAIEAGYMASMHLSNPSQIAAVIYRHICEASPSPPQATQVGPDYTSSFTGETVRFFAPQGEPQPEQRIQELENVLRVYADPRNWDAKRRNVFLGDEISPDQGPTIWGYTRAEAVLKQKTIEPVD